MQRFVRKTLLWGRRHVPVEPRLVERGRHERDWDPLRKGIVSLIVTAGYPS